MHVDAVPAEDVSAVGHLRRLELLLQANGAGKLLPRVVDDLLHLLPFVLLDPLEIRQGLELVVGQRAGVEDEGEPAHEALLAVLHAVSGLGTSTSPPYT
jgi:hypothetical protein